VVPNEQSVERAADIIASAKRPAVLIGKGAAYAGAEDRLKKLIETILLPLFLHLPVSQSLFWLAFCLSYQLRDAEGIPFHMYSPFRKY
jgi:hypothetical protein